MPSAEIITIGTEILLGEIVDTNAAYIARALRIFGIDLYRKTSVGDNVQRIAQAIRQAMDRSEIVITTGGLGPTIDDPTRDAVALALDMKTEYRPELWEQIQDRFRRYERTPTENNKKQAYIPEKASVIENPVGTAPCFLVEIEKHVIISLPGVPSEMEYLMEHDVIPFLRKKYPGNEVLVMKTIHTAGAGESQIDVLIGDLEKLANPTVGLAAHSGQIDIRIVAKAPSIADGEMMIEPLRQDIRRRLDEWIYGENGDTLEKVVLSEMATCGWELAVMEFGLNGALISRLGKAEASRLPPRPAVFVGGEMELKPINAHELREKLREFHKSKKVESALGVTMIPKENKQEIIIVFISPNGELELSRPYGGPLKNAPVWAVNQSLSFIRQFSNGRSQTIKI